MSGAKLHQVLAQTEAGAPTLRQLIADYSRYFAKNQGDFRGERKTYTPTPDYTDIPANRYNKSVVTTVDEKLEYFHETVLPILKAQLNLENTNASGTVTAELVVDGESWGLFSSLELLRLKSFVGNPKLAEMIGSIPVRSDAEQWTVSNHEEYVERELVFEGPTMDYEEKTTEKSEVILADPNVERAIAAGKEINYTPQTTVRTKQVVVGKGNLTKYSGEWSHHARAYALRRLATLKTAINDALARANQAEVLESNVDVDKLLSYLLG